MRKSNLILGLCIALSMCGIILFTQCGKKTTIYDKTAISLADVVFTDSNRTYTTTAQSITATSIPNRIQVAYSIKNNGTGVVTENSNQATAVGVYTITATFSLYNTNAFKWQDGTTAPVTKTATLTIAQGAKTLIDMSGVSMNKLIVGDGTPQMITYTGTLPTGVSSTVNYTGGSPSIAGNYDIVATFTVADPNLYQFDASGATTMTKTAKLVMWKSSKFTTEVVPALIKGCTQSLDGGLTGGTANSGCHGNKAGNTPNKPHLPIFSTPDSMRGIINGLYDVIAADSIYKKFSVNEASVIMNRMLPKGTATTSSMIADITNSLWGQAQPIVDATNNRRLGVPYDSSGVVKIYYYSKWYAGNPTPPALSLSASGPAGSMRSDGFYTPIGGSKTMDTIADPIHSTGKTIDAVLIQWIMSKP